MSKKIQNKNLSGVLSIAVLGEKDHGKSTLIGRLLYETGSLPKDRVLGARSAAKKIGKHFEWAHLLDSFQYEREHEMTLDTTRALVKLGKNLYEFIDVPGHKELIKNMLTGASDAKYGILVIDIKEGITPQTLKHLEIARFLGIEKIIIAVNKIDEIRYSPAEFKRTTIIFSDIFKNNGFAEQFEFIPVEARSGGNIIKKSKKLKWFKGPTLAKAVQKKFTRQKNTNKASDLLKCPSNFEATCFFLKNPGINLELESSLDFKSYPISKLNGFRKIHAVEKVSIALKRGLTMKKNFVIKTHGRIIGICTAL